MSTVKDPRGKGLQSELVQLEAWAQEELAAQAELGKALVSQEDAIRSGSTAGLLSSSDAVAAATRSNTVRERRRLAGLRALARTFGVAVETLTLQSISERAAASGLDVTRLDRLRAEMRVAVADTVKRGRRIAILARQHRNLMDEVFRTIATEQDASKSTRTDGALVVNREA